MRVDRLSIQGFRGFLDRRELPMANGKKAVSLCVYGDNGCGKSSIGDAVEFFFSVDGILARLSKKETENNAGISATRHALAAKKNIRTEVAFHLADGKGFARTTGPGGAAGAMPDEIQQLLEEAPVPLLMRSHEMRAFVADEKGAARYTILSRWVGLERLVAIQDALTRIEGRVRKWDKPAAAKAAQVDSLVKLTERAVCEWTPPAIVRWLNEKLAQAGTTQKMSKLEELERIDERLQALQQNEEDRSRVLRYEAAGDLLDRIALDVPDEGVVKVSTQCRDALRQLDDVRARLTATKLRPVWSAARDYLASTAVSDCPVCARPFDGSVTQASVLSSLDELLAAIKDLENAEARAKTAGQELKRTSDALTANLSRLSAALRLCADDELRAATDRSVALSDHASINEDGPTMSAGWHDELLARVRVWKESLPAARARCAKEGERLRASLSVPFAELRLAVKQLITIREGWNRADREERAQVELNAQLEAVAAAIRADVRNHVRNVLTALEDDVRKIYAALRGNDDHIPTIDVLVAEDKKSMRVAMSLFGINKVPPSGYLSDSQLNSLGLALYLAAVRRFNIGFRFLVLDDVMSSYDASHRLALVNVLAQYLGDFQVIVTTHDQAFFREIRAVLANGGNWQFMKLKPWLLETGVRIDNDVKVDDDIERRLRDGERPEVVAQLIMGNVEDWLLNICCDRGTAVPMKIRKDGAPMEPTLGTLWSSAQKAFEDRHRSHRSYPILLGHSLLNWPRHAATAGELGIVLGDLETFWKHFKTFRDDFASGSGTSTP